MDARRAVAQYLRPLADRHPDRDVRGELARGRIGAPARPDDGADDRAGGEESEVALADALKPIIGSSTRKLSISCTSATKIASGLSDGMTTNRIRW